MECGASALISFFRSECGKQAVFALTISFVSLIFLPVLTATGPQTARENQAVFLQDGSISVSAEREQGMDHRIRYTLQYARQVVEELEEQAEKGELKDRECFVKMFCLGKVLVGWDDEKTKLEQIGFLMDMNEKVMLMQKGSDRRKQMQS